MVGCKDQHTMVTPESLIGRLNTERAVLIAYLRAKTESEDWHAVADAACDLREIDAKVEVLK